MMDGVRIWVYAKIKMIPLRRRSLEKEKGKFAKRGKWGDGGAVR